MVSRSLQSQPSRPAGSTAPTQRLSVSGASPTTTSKGHTRMVMLKVRPGGAHVPDEHVIAEIPVTIRPTTSSS
jgi:hypothetical protein